jgi:PilZ domain
MVLGTIEECERRGDSGRTYPALGRLFVAICRVRRAMMQRNRTLQPVKQRAVRRCPFVASVEVTEEQSGTRLSARTSELAMGGCYIDALNPFPAGTLLALRIVRDQGVFETKAKVVYCDPKFGMGVAFVEMAPNQRTILEGWLAEIVTLLKPIA